MSDDIKLRNAKVTSFTLGPEDHGIMTGFVWLDYGGSSQGFGGYDLRTHNRMAVWVEKLLWVFGVNDIQHIVGKPCRSKADYGHVESIGNYLSDERWFNPRTDLPSTGADK